MQLKLLDASKAVSAFGLPGRDCTSDEIVADYCARGWSDAAIEQHVKCAIAAGAYAVVDDDVTDAHVRQQLAERARIVTIDPRDGVSDQEASAAAQVLSQRKREVKHGDAASRED